MKTSGIEISDIFRDYGSEFRKTYNLPERQTSIMNFMKRNG